MSKYFVIGGKKQLSKKQLEGINQRSQEHLLGPDLNLTDKSVSRLEEDDDLIHVEGRIVCKVDKEGKNYTKFESGLIIRRERAFNEFNRRLTQPVNCMVISADGIPKNAEILVEHNALHETNRINDYKNKFESEDSDRVRYYSIPIPECFCWRIGDGKWTPIYPYEFSLRVFKPYKGLIEGIAPEKLKDMLWVTSGELKDKVVKTLKGCDYEIIFNESFGIEGHLIVFRPNGDEKRNLEEEAIAIMDELTEQVKNGELIIGLEPSKAERLEISAYAD